MEENINALDEINKGSYMGLDAIHFILNKVEDKGLEKVLKKQYKKYKQIKDEIEDIYKKYNQEDTPHKTNVLEKAMTWYGIEIKTFTDETTSKIAELLIKGTNMGIIEGRKILNNKKINKEVKAICQKYVQMGEESLEELKKYL